MGLSADPEVRERQLAALKAGRETAAARRAGGLPRKSRESGQASRVVDGAYGHAKRGAAADGKAGTEAGKTRKPPAKSRQPRKPAKPEPKPGKPGWKDRALDTAARIIGAG
jgi:hypothetical protein